MACLLVVAIVGEVVGMVVMIGFVRVVGGVFFLLLASVLSLVSSFICRVIVLVLLK